MTAETVRRRKRIPKEATLHAKQWITAELLRLEFVCEALQGFAVAYTDHYVKLLFDAEGHPASLALAEENPQLTKRTYTLRSIDPETGRFAIEFVIHGDEGVAAVWAQRATPGEAIAFFGPGGAYCPSSSYSHFVLVGDDTAAPAVLESLVRVPTGSSVDVFLEVNEHWDPPIPENLDVQLHWLIRDGAVPGTMLSQALRAYHGPDKPTSWFVHGVAEMIKDVRHLLFVERQVPKRDVSISGYWRLGMTEDQWQASKQEFHAELEAAESGH